MKSVKEEMYKLIAEYAQSDEKVEDDTELKALNIDSLVFIKMVVGIEKKFGIKVSGADRPPDGGRCARRGGRL